VAKTVKVPEPVYREIERIADRKDISNKAAIQKIAEKAGLKV